MRHQACQARKWMQQSRIPYLFNSLSQNCTLVTGTIVSIVNTYAGAAATELIWLALYVSALDITVRPSTFPAANGPTRTRVSLRLWWRSVAAAAEEQDDRRTNFLIPLFETKVLLTLPTRASFISCAKMTRFTSTRNVSFSGQS